MNDEATRETIKQLTRNADRTRQLALEEITHTIERLQRAREDVEKGSAGYYRYGVIDSSRLDVAVAQAAAAQETLDNIKAMLAAIADQG